MGITVENLPIAFLGIVALGVLIILVGIIRLANHQDNPSLYTNLESNEPTGHLEDLFSFFLQEEEKKNQSFRDMVMRVSNPKNQNELTMSTAKEENKKKKTQETSTQKSQMEKEMFTEIMQRYEAGQDIETIAKELKKGTGEVKLIISLYSMR